MSQTGGDRTRDNRVQCDILDWILEQEKNMGGKTVEIWPESGVW